MRTFFLFVTILVVTLVSCSSYEEPVFGKSEQQSSNKFLSNSEACIIASKAFADFGFEPQSRTARTAFASLYRPSFPSRSMEDTTFYVVNFSEGGFAIVSADRSSNNPIIAISDEGQFHEDGDENVQFYMNYASDRFGPIRDSTKTIVQKLHVDTVITYHDRFMPTLWSQLDPYNRYCPILPNGEKAAAGCVPVAMGQTMAFHRRPTSINGYNLDWEQILCSKFLNKTTSEGVEGGAHLLHELGKMLNVTYSEYGTSAYMPDAVDVFKELGYPDAEYGSDLMKCIETLKLHGPVPVRGYKPGERSGHAWVADAAKILLLKTAFSLSPDVTEYYLHMNWGAAGGNNGYFLVNPEYNNNDIDGHNYLDYITGVK